MIEVRKATIDDFESLLPLFQQLHSKKPLDKEKLREFYNELISSNKHFAWIAFVDGRLAGYMDVVFRTYHFSFGFVARIETTIVDEEMRRKGIGTMLLEKCEEKARKEGCKVIELDSKMNRTIAHQFYENNGYTKRGYLFWKNL